MIMIGDSATDIKTAKTAGICSVAVNYGYGNKSEIDQLNPDYKINCLKIDISKETKQL